MPYPSRFDDDESEGDGDSFTAAGTSPTHSRSLSTFEIDNRYPGFTMDDIVIDSRSTGPSNRVQTTPRFVRTPTISFFDATVRPSSSRRAPRIEVAAEVTFAPGGPLPSGMRRARLRSTGRRV